MVIIMGDLNAEVRNDNTSKKAGIKAHGIGQINENGERQLDFCEMNELVVCKTFDIHKYT